MNVEFGPVKRSILAAAIIAEAILGVAPQANALEPNPSGKVHIIHGDTPVVTDKSKVENYSQKRVYLRGKTGEVTEAPATDETVKEQLVQLANKDVEIFTSPNGQKTVVTNFDVPKGPNTDNLKVGYLKCDAKGDPPINFDLKPEEIKAYERYVNNQLNKTAIQESVYFTQEVTTESPKADYVDAYGNIDLQKLGQACITAAEKTNNLDGLTNINFLLHKYVSPTSWAGISTFLLKGKLREMGVGWYPTNDYVKPQIFHELGHQFGFGHASDYEGLETYGSTLSQMGNFWKGCKNTNWCIPNMPYGAAYMRTIGVGKEHIADTGATLTMTLSENEHVVVNISSTLSLVAELYPGGGYWISSWDPTRIVPMWETTKEQSLLKSGEKRVLDDTVYCANGVTLTVSRAKPEFMCESEVAPPPNPNPIREFKYNFPLVFKNGRFAQESQRTVFPQRRRK